MHNIAVVATQNLDKEYGPMLIKRIVGVAACSLLLAVGGYSGIVAAADEHQHPMDMPADMPMDHSQHQMDMPMDHSGHENGMDHSGHEQHMAMMEKSGKFTRSVATYVEPEVKMLDMSGKNVSLQQELAGDKPVFLNFIFTTCTTICPVMSATFQQVQDMLGKQRNKVRMVSISIDPEHDTPATLKEYAAKYGADSQWTLLTGTVADSTEVQKAFAVYSGDKMNHQPVTFLKAKGSENSWVRLDGLVDASNVIKEYKKLKAK